VSSDLVCRELKTSGSFRACGSVDCNGEVRTSGGFHCEGDLIAGDFSGSGTAKVQGSLKSGLMHVPGALTVGGNLSAGELRVSGSLKVGGDCEADSFTASGSLNVGGIINADTVDIRLSVAESRVGSTAGFLSSILKPGVGSLTCESIEGDTVELSGVKATTVRGGRVVIHSGCAIDQVEYTETCSIDEGAVVGACVKV
jgi:cytoskeletal protein CcmA (bactofilin family)